MILQTPFIARTARSKRRQRRFPGLRHRPLRRRLALAFLMTATCLTSATSHVHAADSYVLSGTVDGTGTFDVDDNLDVYLNGVLIYADNVPPGTPLTHNPISLD